jgi:hypothetical protein
MPMDITVLDLSAYVGLTAVGTITINMLLGTLMAFRYSPVRQWPHRRVNYFRLHNISGYVALSLAVLHPLVLLFDKTAKFRVLDLLYPVHSPSQPFENTIGAVALYVVAIVVVTSYLRAPRPPSLEIFSLHGLHRRRRSLLAQPLHRPRPEKFPHRLVRRRQTLRRSLPLNHHRDGRSAMAPLCKGRRLERLIARLAAVRGFSKLERRFSQGAGCSTQAMPRGVRQPAANRLLGLPVEPQA